MTQSNQEQKVLDPKALAVLQELERATGQEGFVADLLVLFVSQATKRLELMRKLVVAQDIKALGAEAHALKSSAANVGAFRMQELARRIEHYADDQQGQEAMDLVSPLELEFPQVVLELGRAVNMEL